MSSTLDLVIDTGRYPLHGESFRTHCRNTLESDGCLLLDGFLTSATVDAIRREGEEKQNLAFYCVQNHNVYLSPPDPQFGESHPRNRRVNSSKGCITDDQISSGSPLRTLYDSQAFRDFLCAVLNEDALYPYADPLSSINLHYANEGQELGWHFDNSSFAITLMIQNPGSGGTFEYVRGLRDSKNGDTNFDGVENVLNGGVTPHVLNMNPGTLVLFRGRNAMHRVTPVKGDRTRILVVLAYNAEPGIALSESARMIFYGRLD